MTIRRGDGISSASLAGEGVVSVIIPAFNAAEYVSAAVQSALTQTLCPREVIVVNDGSTDETLGRLASFGNSIRVLSQANRGPAEAKNVGARLASAEWLAFLDADDTWLPQKLERQMAAVDGDTALVYTDRFNVGDRGWLPPVQGHIQPPFEGDVFQDLLLKGNYITTSSVLVRRALFLELGGFRADLPVTEDWDLWIRLAERHLVKVCREPLVNYRLHPGQISKNCMRMWYASNEVTRSALRLQRGRGLPFVLRRRIWARTWQTNGFYARCTHQRSRAIWAHSLALVYWPFAREGYRPLIKALLGLE